MNEYRMWVDRIETTSISGSYLPDPDWVAVDSNGHEHRYEPEGLVSGVLVNAHWEYEEWIDADGDDRIESVALCDLCGEEIEPGTIFDPPKPYRTYIPGQVHFEIDGVEVSEAEFRAAAPVGSPEAPAGEA